LRLKEKGLSFEGLSSKGKKEKRRKREGGREENRDGSVHARGGKNLGARDLLAWIQRGEKELLCSKKRKVCSSAP